jgi:hypothetical protein
MKNPNKSNTLKKSPAAALLLGLLISQSVLAETDQQAQIDALKQHIEHLSAELNDKINTIADSVEQSGRDQNATNQVHIGGYGEMHYAALDTNGKDQRELDFHRMVLFFGYEFNERIRFVSEFEIEHIIASAGSRGAVELEQVYIEMDVREGMRLQTGAMLMPIGIINETHEPPRFYGVERPIVETTIIPTTWWSNGIQFIHEMENSLRYDIMLSEGLQTQDPSVSSDAEPFNLKAGKQKGSFARAFDLAVTARIRYTGIAGLELASYAQYQPDLDQSAEQSYADSATLIGAHVIYQWQAFSIRALYARWDLAGEQAKAAGKDLQDGAYLEASWHPSPQWGGFIRQSEWSQEAGNEASQSDIGINYYPHPDIVFKADYQVQNDDAGNSDGFHLGMGYQF